MRQPVKQVSWMANATEKSERIIFFPSALLIKGVTRTKIGQAEHLGTEVDEQVIYARV